MSDRWVLNRAGILNVYQYGDEVLSFAGGRLLLRGVNGSGKSTAMNMLLPFLLDADTRRIDAAGVQQGVLRSWMLTGRDEQQPVGYLWLELARGDEHVVFGCGIRASQSSETVTTWWFITDRRPHVDLNLLDGRTPRSIDSLREALGPHSSVFTKDQRNAYRAELRSRLYGGADLDQHIRLLHVLRNPTVGDRIDSDLNRYLDEALPQLSEQAIDDAAQPLEDLEEHRRNVGQLTATDDTMRALATTYSSYARSELRAVAARASTDVSEVTQLRRRHDRLHREAELAAAALDEARQAVGSLEADVSRLNSEISAFKDQPLYQEGKNLEDLRRHVASLTAQLASAAQRIDEATRRRDDEVDAEQQAASTVQAQHTSVLTQLNELRSVLALHHVEAAVADLPSITPDDAATGTATPLAEASALVGVELGAVTTAIGIRKSEVDDVRRALGAVNAAVNALEQCTASVARTRAELDAASSDLTHTEAASLAATTQFHTDLGRWSERAVTLGRAISTALGEPPAVAADTDVRGERAELLARSTAWAQGLLRHVDQAVAHAGEATRVAVAAEDEARAELQVLLDQVEPDPPSLAWQLATDEPCLAALVDFRDEVGPHDRLGLESALEASGLLAATVRDAEVRLATGDLVATSGPAVPRPLSDLLAVTIPAAYRDHIAADRVRAALDVISVDIDSDAPTAVATDGRFRLGSLAGRHRRPRLGLIGVTARRAALERQRDEARSALDAAERQHASARSELEQWTGRRGEATTLTDALPSTVDLDRAILAEGAARDLVDLRTDALGAIEAEAVTAERLRDQREDDLRRVAASRQLPRSEPELRTVEADLNEAREHVARVKVAVSTLDTSVSHWTTARTRVAAARADVAREEEQHRAALAQHEPEAARLATLEDSLGTDYRLLLDALRVSEHDLDEAATSLPPARQQVEDQITTHAKAVAVADTARLNADVAEAGVIVHLDRLRSALAVPGLALAAWSPDLGPPDTESLDVSSSDGASSPSAEPGGVETALPVPPAVDRSSAGVSTLARWIIDHTPSPAQEVNAESVRMSLRQRRNSLGAGWDAEDRQPDATLPLTVEVNGPEGRFPLAEAARVVNARLHQQQNLLDAKQTQALRNLLQGLIAREIAAKLGAARELVKLMNDRLGPVETAHGIRVSLQWRRRDDLDGKVGAMIDLLAKPPDLRTADDDRQLIEQISQRIDDARADEPEAPYRDLIAGVLDYRHWHQMRIMLHRPGQSPQRLGRRTALSEGEKKVVSYLPLFAAVAASCDALAEHEPAAPRFVLLDDAFAKVSTDNHEKLFGLLVEMDLDFIATSERLWGTHATVPELAITEVIRDADAGVILLEHARWNGTEVEVGRHG